MAVCPPLKPEIYPTDLFYVKTKVCLSKVRWCIIIKKQSVKKNGIYEILLMITTNGAEIPTMSCGMANGSYELNLLEFIQKN